MFGDEVVAVGTGLALEPFAVTFVFRFLANRMSIMTR